MLKKFFLTVLFCSIIINLITVGSSNIYAEIKCYENNSTVKRECLWKVDTQAPSIDGGLIAVTDGKCYQYGSGEFVTAIAEIECPKNGDETDADDPPVCYTGINVETDCDGIKAAPIGQEWRRPDRFLNGRCYREIEFMAFSQQNTLKGIPLNQQIGTVWAEVSCVGGGAELKNPGCIFEGLCNDEIGNKIYENSFERVFDSYKKEKEKNEKPTCEDGFNFILDWAVCGILGWIDSGMEALISVVDSQLSVGSEELTTDEMKQAWTYFRNIASLMLVVIGLTMIIGQALSKE